MQEPLPLHAIPLNTPTAEEQEEVRLRLVERDKVKMNTNWGKVLKDLLLPTLVVPWLVLSPCLLWVPLV